MACDLSWSTGTSHTPLNPSPRAGLAQVLVPTSPSAPVYVTICRYAGLNQTVKPGTLERSRVLMGPQLASLVAYLDEPNWGRVPAGGSVNCPMSIGSLDILQFVYTSAPDVTLSVDVGGCSFVSNGQRTVWGGSIAQRLAEYVGSDSFPG